METFYLCNGREIKDLSELADALKSIPPEIFMQHVNPEKNDFAAWIAPHDALLADLLAHQRDPFVIEQLVRARLAHRRHPRADLDALPIPDSGEMGLILARDPDLAQYFKSPTLTKAQFFGLLGRAYEHLGRRQVGAAKHVYLKLKDAYECSPLPEPDAQRVFEAIQDYFYEVCLAMAEEAEAL